MFFKFALLVFAGLHLLSIRVLPLATSDAKSDLSKRAHTFDLNQPASSHTFDLNKPASPARPGSPSSSTTTVLQAAPLATHPASSSSSVKGSKSAGKSWTWGNMLKRVREQPPDERVKLKTHKKDMSAGDFVQRKLQQKREAKERWLSKPGVLEAYKQRRREAYAKKKADKVAAL